MLGEADLAILRDEGCVVDLEAASRAYALTIDEDHDGPAQDHQRAGTDAALRAVGLVPGAPSLDLLASAVERRGWDWDAYTKVATPGHHGAQVTTNGDWGYGHEGHAEGRTEALALAFLKAIRAGQEARTDGG